MQLIRYILLLFILCISDKASGQEINTDSIAFHQLLQTPDEFSDSLATEIYLRTIGNVLFSNMDSAKEMYLEMAEFGLKHQFDLMVAKAYYTYGFLAQYREDFETQEIYIKKALPYIGNKIRLKADFYGALGLVYIRLNKMELAETYIDSSIHFSVITQDSSLLNTAYMNKAELYNKDQKFNSAIQYALKALPLVPLGNQLRKVGIYKWIGRNYLNIRDFDKAISYSEQALLIAKNLAYSRSLAEIQNLLGNIYLAMEDYQIAQDYYSSALEHFAEKKPGLQLLDLYSNILFTNVKLDKLSQAKALARKADDLFKQINNPNRTFLYHWAMGHYYLLDNQNPRAKKAFETLLSNGRKYGRLESVISAFEGLQFWAKKEERWKESSIYSDSILHYRSKKDLVNQRNTVYDLETKYNTALTNANIQRLEDESRINALTIDQKNKQVYFLLVGLLLVFCSLLGIIYAYKTKQRSNRKLREVNLKLSESLERNKSLVKEIHHRVKNNLQVVSSLLNLQGRFEKDFNVQQAIQSGKDRVHSISLLHKRLYENEDLSTVNIKSYFKELIDHIVHTFKGREHDLIVNLAIDQLELDIDTVVPLGLITNELVTNCMKYAYGTQVQPRLDFSLKVSGNGFVTLHISDNGPGLPFEQLPKNPKTLGIQLIKSFARRMDAKIEMSNTNGSSIKIIFPIENLNIS